MEEALGEKVAAIARTTAGRKHIKNLAGQNGLKIISSSWHILPEKLRFVLGKDSTHLCTESADKACTWSRTLRR